MMALALATLGVFAVLVLAALRNSGDCTREEGDRWDEH